MTYASALGEAVMVDLDGNVWFTQGGSSLYSGNASNHARIVMYNPSSEQSKVYNLPGDKNEIIGITWDDNRKRIWTAQAGFDAGAALISFDPDKIMFDGEFDFSESLEHQVCLAGESYDDCYRFYYLLNPTSRPAHLIIDEDGYVWTTLMWDNAIARLNPETGEFIEIPLSEKISEHDWFFWRSPLGDKI